MNKDLMFGTIFTLENEVVIVTGVSKVVSLEQMRDIGCVGTNDFTTMRIESEDSKITNDSILIFKRSHELYHNRATAPEDVVIYKSLEDEEGAKCVCFSTFVKSLKCESSIDDNKIKDLEKNYGKTALEPVFSNDL